MDPVSAFIVSTVIGGIVGNRADDLTVTSVKKIAARLAGIKAPINHDLQRCILQSFHHAGIIVLREFLKRESQQENWRRFFLNTPAISWSRDTITGLKRALRELEKGAFSDDLIDLTDINIRRFLETPADEEFNAFSNEEITLRYLAVIQDGFPGIPDKLVSLFREGWIEEESGHRLTWYSLVSAFFVEELKNNGRLQQVFSNELMTDFASFSVDTEASLAYLTTLGQDVLVRIEQIKTATTGLQELKKELYDLVRANHQQLKDHLRDAEQRQQLIRQYGGREAQRKSENKIAHFHTKSLCERTDALRRIDRFIGEEAGGKLAITAPAGLGKSAMLSDWIDKRKNEGVFICRHFFSETGRSVLDLYTNLLKQLYVYYNLSDEEIPTEESRLRDIITGLILNLGAREDEGLVIVIDGLDEAEELVEPLIFDPPAGVYLLFSYRAGKGDNLQNLAGWMESTERLKLDNLSATACDNWLSDHPQLLPYPTDLRAKITKSLFEITEGYPLYLSLLLDDASLFEGDIVSNLGEMPKGLQSYVRNEFRQLARNRTLQSDRNLQLLFAVLAVADAPLTENDLEEMLEISRWELSSLPQSVSRWLDFSMSRDTYSYSFTHPFLADEFRKVLGRDEQRAQELMMAYCARWKDTNSLFVYTCFPKLLVQLGRKEELTELLLDTPEWRARKRGFLKSDRGNMRDIEMALAAIRSDADENDMHQQLRLLNELFVHKSNSLGTKLTSGNLFCLAAFGNSEEAYILAATEEEAGARLYNFLVLLLGTLLAGGETKPIRETIQETISALREDSEKRIQKQATDILSIAQSFTQRGIEEELKHQLLALLWHEANEDSHSLNTATIVAHVLETEGLNIARERWVELSQKMVRMALRSFDSTEFPYDLLRYGDYTTEISQVLEVNNWDINNRWIADHLLAALVDKNHLPPYTDYIADLFPSNHPDVPVNLFTALLKYDYYEEWAELFGSYGHLPIPHWLFSLIGALKISKWAFVLNRMPEQADPNHLAFTRHLLLLVDYMEASEGSHPERDDTYLSEFVEKFDTQQASLNTRLAVLTNEVRWTDPEAKRLLPLLVSLFPEQSSDSERHDYVYYLLPVLLKFNAKDLVEKLLEKFSSSSVDLKTSWHQIIFTVASRYPGLAVRLHTTSNGLTLESAENLKTIQQVLIIMAAAFHRLGLPEHEERVAAEILARSAGRYAGMTEPQTEAIGGILASLGRPVPSEIDGPTLLPFRVGALLERGELSAALDLIDAGYQDILDNEDKNFECFSPLFEALSLCVRYSFDYKGCEHTEDRLEEAITHLLGFVASDETTYDWDSKFLDVPYGYEWAVLYADVPAVSELLKHVFDKFDLPHKLVPVFEISHAVIAACLRRGDLQSAQRLAVEVGWLSYADYDQIKHLLPNDPAGDFAQLAKFPYFYNANLTDQHSLKDYLNDLQERRFEIAYSHLVFLITANAESAGRATTVTLLLKLLEAIRRRVNSLTGLVTGLEALTVPPMAHRYECNEEENQTKKQVEVDASELVDFLLGDLHCSHKELDQALSSYENTSGAASLPFLQEALQTRIGYVQLLSGNNDQALDSFQSANRLRPDNYSSTSDLLTLYAHTGEWEAALGQIGEWEKLIPEKAVIYKYWKFSFLLSTHDIKEAAAVNRAIRVAAETAPEDDALRYISQANYNDGLLAWLDGKENLAHQYWRKVVEFHQEGPGKGIPPALPILGISTVGFQNFLSKMDVTKVVNRIISRASMHDLTSIRQIYLSCREINLVSSFGGNGTEHYLDLDSLKIPSLDNLSTFTHWIAFENHTNALPSLFLRQNINSNYLNKGFICVYHMTTLTPLLIPSLYTIGLNGTAATEEILQKRRLSLLRESAVILMQGRDIHGRKVYTYLKISMKSFALLSVTMANGLNFDPSDFGEVLTSGIGEPSMSLQAELSIRYNLVALPRQSEHLLPE
jgi:hypothetical protein